MIAISHIVIINLNAYFHEFEHFFSFVHRSLVADYYLIMKCLIEFISVEQQQQCANDGVQLNSLLDWVMRAQRKAKKELRIVCASKQMYSIDEKKTIINCNLECKIRFFYTSQIEIKRRRREMKKAPIVWHIAIH